MSRRTRHATAAAAALLAAAIAGELAGGPSPAPAPDPGRGSGMAAVRVPGERSAIRDVEAWAAAALARPLFSPGRRPASRAAGPHSADGTPRLAGVMVGPDGGRAIFARAGGRAEVVGAGARVGPWQVHAIEPGQVTVTGPQGELVLRPAYEGGLLLTRPPH